MTFFVGLPKKCLLLPFVPEVPDTVKQAPSRKGIEVFSAGSRFAVPAVICSSFTRRGMFALGLFNSLRPVEGRPHNPP